MESKYRYAIEDSVEHTHKMVDVIFKVECTNRVVRGRYCAICGKIGTPIKVKDIVPRAALPRDAKGLPVVILDSVLASTVNPRRVVGEI